MIWGGGRVRERENSRNVPDNRSREGLGGVCRKRVGVYATPAPPKLASLLSLSIIEYVNIYP